MNGLILVKPEYQMEVLEQAFKLPPEVRDAFLFSQVDLGKAYFLGTTKLSGPELSIEANKQGVKTKYFGGHTHEHRPSD
jgi:hypothetical protein